MKTLAFERTDNIAVVTLLGTTMPPRFFAELREVFQEIQRDDTFRVVVLQGAEKAFSFGLDLPTTMKKYGNLFTGEGQAGPRSELLALIRELQSGVNAVAECPVPVIAAIHGWCIGGGLDLISACDIRLASRDAVFSLRETRIAIVADLGSLQRLPHIIGKGHTRQLAFTGEDIDAERAAAIGLVNRVFEGAEAVRQGALEMATAIAANPPLTVRGIKNVLNYCEDKSTTDGLAYVAAWNAAFLASEDLIEALAAFLEKRDPDFKGR